MFTLSLHTGIVTREDGVIVAPTVDLQNPDYVAYQEWLQQGNTPLVFIEDAQASLLAVTPRQIRLALNIVGLRESVESMVQASSQEVKDTWDFSTEIERTNPLLIQMGEALGRTSADLDALFELANTL